MLGRKNNAEASGIVPNSESAKGKLSKIKMHRQELWLSHWLISCQNPLGQRIGPLIGFSETCSAPLNWTRPYPIQAPESEAAAHVQHGSGPLPLVDGTEGGHIIKPASSATHA